MNYSPLIVLGFTWSLAIATFFVGTKQMGYMVGLAAGAITSAALLVHGLEPFKFW